MKYYKVKPDNDNTTRFKFHRGGGLEIDGVFVRNELYTAREISRYLGGVSFCDVVEIPKNQIYWNFGCRFETEG